MSSHVAATLANSVSSRFLSGTCVERGGAVRELLNRFCDQCEISYQLNLKRLRDWIAACSNTTLDYGVWSTFLESEEKIRQCNIMPLLKELGRPAKQLRAAIRKNEDMVLTQKSCEEILVLIEQWK